MPSDDGWASIPRSLLYDPVVPPGAKLVYIAVSSHINVRTGVAFPSHGLVGGYLGMHRTTVLNHLKWLREHGYISWVGTARDDGGQTANQYLLTMGPPVAPADTPVANCDSTLSNGSTPPVASSDTNVLKVNEPKKERSARPTQASTSGARTAKSTASKATPTAATRIDINALFAEFWRVYPRHEGRAPAQVKYRKAIEHTDPAVIHAGAERYRDDPNREDAYTAHAATWLNQKRWEDEPLPKRQPHSAAEPIAPRRPQW